MEAVKTSRRQDVHLENQRSSLALPKLNAPFLAAALHAIQPEYATGSVSSTAPWQKRNKRCDMWWTNKLNKSLHYEYLPR